MKRSLRLIVGCLWILIISSQAIANLPQNSKVPPELNKRITSLLIPFIENRGQTNKEIAYYANTFSGTLFVSKDGELSLKVPSSDNDGKVGVLIQETFTGAEVKKVSGIKPSATSVNIYRGNDPNGWRENISTFEQVSLGELYDGIELKLNSSRNNVEKIFYIEPGANPDRIRIKVDGIEKLQVQQDGLLSLHTKYGSVKYTKPIAYQVINNKRQYVDVAYHIVDDHYAFKLGTYDSSKQLIIDPLLQATYIGGRGDETLQYMSTGNGSVYVSGYTTSTAFVDPGGTADIRTDDEIFVARLNSDLTTLQTVAFFGGAGDERPYGINVSGNVVVMGSTKSQDIPTPGSPPQPVSGGLDDAFVALFDANLSLIRATYLGGSLIDTPNSMATSGTSIYIAGTTNSTDFPSATGGGQPEKSVLTGPDAFVAHLSSDISSIHQSSYLGGSTGGETEVSIALHPSNGKLYMAGSTAADDFPTTGVIIPQENYGGGWSDIFVAVFSSNLTDIEAATYLGGNDSDYKGSSRILFHPTNGQVYVAGSTESTSFGFSITELGVSPRTTSDMFIVRLTPDLAGIVQATVMGGSYADGIFDIAIHPSSREFYLISSNGSPDFPGTLNSVNGVNDGLIVRMNELVSVIQNARYMGGSGTDNLGKLFIHPSSGDVYVAGGTRSTDLPGRNGGAQASLGGEGDGYISRLSADLTTIHQSSYFGGTDNDWVSVMAHNDVTNEIYIGGGTTSSDFPDTDGGAQHDYNGPPKDGYLIRLDEGLTGQVISPDPDISISPTSIGLDMHQPKVITISNNGNAQLNISGMEITAAAPNVATDFILDVSGVAPACGTTMPSLNFGESCEVSIEFAPSTRAADQTAVLHVYSNDPDEGDVQTQLIGNYVEPVPDIKLSPAGGVVEFGEIMLGTSVTATFSIENTGSANLKISKIIPSGNGASLLAMTLSYGAGPASCTRPIPPVGSDPGTPIIIAPGEKCSVNVTFEPTLVAEHKIKMDIFWNTPRPPIEDPGIKFMNAHGVGVAPPEDELVVTDLDFRQVVVGQEKTLIATIHNQGPHTININPAVLFGVDVLLGDGKTRTCADFACGDFSMDATYDNSFGCGGDIVNWQLPPGNLCGIEFTFHPDEVYAGLQGAVTFRTDHPDPLKRNLTIILTGTSGLDEDSDNVIDTEEWGPIGNDTAFDGNDDGIPDSQQDNVASLHSFDGEAYVTLAASAGKLVDVSSEDNPEPSTAPEGWIFPLGFYDFKVVLPAGVNNTIVTIHIEEGLAGVGYWKYGPTPDNAARHWYNFECESSPGPDNPCAEHIIEGGLYKKIDLHLTDGVTGDHDLIVNGVIEDPGAPAVGPATGQGDEEEDGGGGFCFIATAAYGSYLDPQVKVLRDFRDNYLLTNEIGTSFVNFYYATSPPIANYIREYDELRTITRWVLTPVVYTVKHLIIALTVLILFMISLIATRSHKRTVAA